MNKPHFLLLSLIIVALDQWSKWWVERSIEAYHSVEVIPGFFQLIMAKNTGIAFGLFPSRGEALGTAILAAFGLLALGLVATLFVRTPAQQPLLLLALALVLGGAIGNLTDRVMLGAVTDFLDVFVGTRHFPTFNIADSAISVGIVFLAWDSVFGQHAAPGPETESNEPSSPDEVTGSSAGNPAAQS